MMEAILVGALIFFTWIFFLHKAKADGPDCVTSRERPIDLAAHPLRASAGASWHQYQNLE